ncbi:enterochelin ABC transporter substrate-binding protein [Campylobacter sp. MIT 12-5580]|uniref:siderophore ABC transporter substrate-binding protein n=1 Tax=Campylobacter sp. MIT 12-5580 TaxID=2040651 RepID=UPI0010F922BA|nr:siderophore ABC transporter substrate-binding protein [Campylobacter sp. MIT 12-5580]TKX28790.1 enterochelin ABC transporter substrate-binding protein [Campylobacter sp. MIT 12-5580]
MKKTLFITIFSVFAFFACSNDKSTQQDSNSTESNTSIKEKARVQVSYKPLVLHDKGSSFEIEHSLGKAEVIKNPSKVIIFDLGALDTFDALGLNDRVVGVTSKTLPKYLEQFKDKASVGAVNEADFEKVNELQADLIITSGRQAKFFDKLNQIAPTIYVGTDNANFLNSFENKVITLATLFDKQEEAKAQLEAIKADIESKKAELDPSKKALIVLTNANRISVFGEGSRFGIIHDVLGIKAADESIKAGTHGNRADSEYILKINPDYLFVVDRNVIVGNQERAQTSLDNPLVAKTNAAMNGKIIYLDPEYWYLSGGGLESFKVMVDEVFKALK